MSANRIRYRRPRSRTQHPEASALASSHSPRADPLTCVRVDQPFVELSHRCNLWRRNARGRVGCRVLALQRSGVPTAVPGVGEEGVRAQAAILGVFDSTGYHEDGTPYDRPGRATVALSRQKIGGDWVADHT